MGGCAGRAGADTLAPMAAGGEVRVRALLPADMDAVRWLHSFLEVQYPEDFYAELLDGRGPRDLLSMEAPRIVLCLVAELHGDVVGVVTARVTEGAKAWSVLGDVLSLLCGCCGYREHADPPVGYIMSVIVSPACRSRGIGKRLLQEMHGHIAHCTHFGAVRLVRLHCLISNQAARLMYAAVGYHETRRLPSFYYFSGAWHDALELSLSLEDPALLHDLLPSA